jgi:hydroxyacylglutathione hydrolase
MLNIHPVNAFEDNYIWFIQAPNSQQVLIVDPGDHKPVVAAIEQHGFEPVAILVTHGCHDHVGGIEALLSDYDIPVYGPKNEFIPHITHSLSEHDSVDIQGFPNISILDIPGHTKGHIGFLVEDKLFCGDALFAAGCGRLHSGPASILFTSLNKIKQLPEHTEIYCAHEYTENNCRFAIIVEPDNTSLQKRLSETSLLRQQGRITLPSTLSLELATNPFLRCDKTDVINSVQAYAGEIMQSEQQVFTALRLWKDKL